jgi:hypothetical protein
MTLSPRFVATKTSGPPEFNPLDVVCVSGNQRAGYLESGSKHFLRRMFTFVIRGVRNPQLNFDAGVWILMINKITKSLLILAVGGLMVVGVASAQTQDSNTSGAGPGQYDPNHPRVNEVNNREQNQQDRIANGVKNGTMTPGQAAHVEKQEQHIENQEKADMAAHNGHLTKREQKQLNREQNHTSKEIYKDKHSAK